MLCCGCHHDKLKRVGIFLSFMCMEWQAFFITVFVNKKLVKLCIQYSIIALTVLPCDNFFPSVINDTFRQTAVQWHICENPGSIIFDQQQLKWIVQSGSTISDDDVISGWRFDEGYLEVTRASSQPFTR